MKKEVLKKNPPDRKHHTFDASEFPIGRLATRVSALLRGKNKVTYEFNRDMGDFVTITNASKVKMSGKKVESKVYYHFSGYQGGIKEERASELIVKRPELIIKRAIFHMIPKNRLKKHIMKRLTIKA
ncbi:MAG: 50S ribosomal protein L13 [Parcubacteria group bacterium GW2011_GWA2_38_13]|nr:MAG: 50S ribosomal protein L13 [Parcubacteria group bacterium GW2011_GWA2_38_13]